MIGPPGLPKYPRRVFSFAASRRAARRRNAWRWLAGLYLMGVVAHFSHSLALDLAAGRDPSFGEAIATDAVSLVWPADLIGSLINSS